MKLLRIEQLFLFLKPGHMYHVVVLFSKQSCLINVIIFYRQLIFRINSTFIEYSKPFFQHLSATIVIDFKPICDDSSIILYCRSLDMDECLINSQHCPVIHNDKLHRFDDFIVLVLGIVSTRNDWEQGNQDADKFFHIQSTTGQRFSFL